MKTRNWILSLLLLSAPWALQAQDEPPGEGLPPPAIPSEDAAPLIAEGEEAAQPARGETSNEPGADQSGRPTPLPPKVEGEDPEAEVNIRRRGDRTIEEYSIGGRIYMVKIIPDNGIPYFYFDADGDGRLESKVGEDLMEPVKPAQYKLLEWD